MQLIRKLVSIIETVGLPAFSGRHELSSSERDLASALQATSVVGSAGSHKLTFVESGLASRLVAASVGVSPDSHELTAGERGLASGFDESSEGLSPGGEFSSASALQFDFGAIAGRFGGKMWFYQAFMLAGFSFLISVLGGAKFAISFLM